MTTRSKGTGLGLAIVKKIMEDHGGHLVLDDREGGGARVSLVFRRDAKEIASPVRTRRAAHDPHEHREKAEESWATTF